jgi:hypothetical protein
MYCIINIFIILDLRFSRLAFVVKLRLAGISRIEYLELSNVSANVTVAILRVNMQVNPESGNCSACRNFSHL